MIKDIENVLKGVFEELGYLDYLKVSYSDKADAQINSVFQISKDKHISPKEVGESIVDAIQKIDNFSDYFKSVLFVLPGFININLSDKYISDFINQKKYISNNKKSELYFLDYGGPNIAKPLHIGHLRPAIIGESLKRILKYAGYNVISDVHLGDYGLQIGQVIYGIVSENKGVDDITIDYLNYIYPKMSALCKTNEEVYNNCKKTTVDFQNGLDRYLELYKKIKEVSIKDITRIYEYLGVSFDLWLGESDAEGSISKVKHILNEKGLLKLDDGALVVYVKKEDDNKEMPPCLIEKSDGSNGYPVTDIATIYDRVNEYNPDYILYVTDPRQSLHFEQVFRVTEFMGLTNKAHLEHIPFGTINGSDGRPFKTRSGDALKLDILFNEVKTSFLSKREENKNMSEEDLNIIINAIVKFADLQNNREKNYNFDISKFSEVSGKTGPYILYSALRVRKLLLSNECTNNMLSGKIHSEIDRELRIKIMEAEKYLNKAVTERMPSYIAEYIYDLCNLLNSFYESENISKLSDDVVKNDYLNILNVAYNLVKDYLNLLIIDLPSAM